MLGTTRSYLRHPPPYINVLISKISELLGGSSSAIDGFYKRIFHKTCLKTGTISNVLNLLAIKKSFLSSSHVSGDNHFWTPDWAIANLTKFVLTLKKKSYKSIFKITVRYIFNNI